MSRPIDLTGRIFGRLRVVCRSEKRDSSGSRSYWECLCECGNTTTVHRTNLLSGRTQSCGCLHRKIATEQATQHGGYGTRLYKIWAGMLFRCNNPACGEYENYGGRGIRVCEEWSQFETFRKWACTHGYKENLSIDRLNVDGNYYPENCRWATRDQQANNTRRTIHVEFNGKVNSLSEWAKTLNITRQTLWKRIFLRNWSVEKAFTTPLQNNGYMKKKSRRTTNNEYFVDL